MFKFILLIASLAYASAGHAGSVHSYDAPVNAHYAPAAAVSYSTVTRSHSYPAAVSHGHTHSAPVLAYGPAHTVSYAVPQLQNKHHVYGHNFAPAHSYEQGYAQYLSHGNNYEYSRYGGPQYAKVVKTVAQVPLYQDNSYAVRGAAVPVVATHGYNYGGAYGHGHHQGHYVY